MPTTSPLLPSKSLALTAGIWVLATTMELSPCVEMMRAGVSKYSDPHFRHVFGNGETCFRRFDDLPDGYARSSLNKRCGSASKSYDREFGDYHLDRPHRRDGKRALL